MTTENEFAHSHDGGESGYGFRTSGKSGDYITGGSEGIGKASALRLCEEGAEVAICARRPDILQKAADEIKAKTGKEVLAMAVDVCNEVQVQDLVQKTVERFGGIDILVNNAGGSRAFPFLEASEETWRRY